jgi:hypothetical protein
MNSSNSIKLFFALLAVGTILPIPGRAVSTRGPTAGTGGDLTAGAKDWTPGKGSAPARSEPDGIRFDLSFAARKADRFYWDRIGSVDLSGAHTLRLDLTCGKPDALRSLALYLQSGKGWYVAAHPLRVAGRQTLLFHRGEFTSEGSPAGWNHISRIRLSPWKGVSTDTSLVLHRLTARRESIVLVEGALSLPDEAERKLAGALTTRVSRWLADSGIPHSRMLDRELPRGGLQGASVAVLCHMARLPDSVLSAVRRHLEDGGKLIVLYSADEHLAAEMGFELREFRKAEVPMQWASFTFIDTLDGTLPDRVYQEAPNLIPAAPKARNARILAWWEDAAGRRCKEPAWLVSDRGYWMTHILRQGDSPSKQHLLAGMLASFEPTLWPDIARAAMQRGSRIDSFENYPQTVSALRAMEQPLVDRKLEFW